MGYEICNISFSCEVRPELHFSCRYDLVPGAVSAVDMTMCVARGKQTISCHVSFVMVREKRGSAQYISFLEAPFEEARSHAG